MEEKKITKKPATKQVAKKDVEKKETKQVSAPEKTKQNLKEQTLFKEKSIEEIKQEADKSFKKKHRNKKIVWIVLAILMLLTAGIATPIIIVNANNKVDITVKSSNAAMQKYKVKVKKGTNISKIKVVELDGYDFVGFFKDEACTKAYKSSDTLKKDATIYASYKVKEEPIVPITYTLIINGQETLIPSFSDITIGDAIKNIENLPYETSGAVYLDEACTQEADLNATRTSNTILYTKAATLDKLSFTWNETSSCWTVKALNSSIGGEVVIPASYAKETNNGNVTTIGYDAFYYCKNINDLFIAASVTDVQIRAFQGCAGLTKLTFSNINLWNDAFSGCTGLTELTISNSNIGFDAFSGCTQLKTIKIDGDTNLGQDFSMGMAVYEPGSPVFRGCKNLETIVVDEKNPGGYRVVDNCLITGDTLILGCKTSVIPNDGSVKRISYNAFQGCDTLTEIIIPYSVTTIEEMAFAWCEGLTEIIIPSGITYIGGDDLFGAFKECGKLKIVTIDSAVISNSLTRDVDNGCLVKNATTIYIKNGLDTSNSTYLTSYFTKQATSDKAGYDKWVRK